MCRIPDSKLAVKFIMDFLPYELKIEIFKYLDLHDRLRCRRVSKLWLEILTSDTVFKQDWRVEINGTYAQSVTLYSATVPVRVLSNSHIDFRYAKIGKYVIYVENFSNFCFFKNIEELDIHASHLEVHERRYRLRCHDTFCSMPQLKHLIIRDCSQDYFEAFYIFNETVLEELTTVEALLNMEKLTIILEEIWSVCMINFFEQLEVLCTIRPKLKTLAIENLSEDNNYQLLDFRLNHPELTIHVSYIAKFSRTIRIYKINNYSKEDYEKVESSLGDKYFHYFWKDTIRLNVVSNTLNNLGVENDWPTRYLVHMKELRELTIRSVKSSCFFGHNRARNLNVHFLELIDCMEPCLECMSTIKFSFPNLRKLVHDCPNQDTKFKLTVGFSERTTVVHFRQNYSLDQ